MTDIVIIGAGPVGLWTAIQLKKREPQLSITMYEKYEEYQRSHVLRLDYWSMILYAKQTNDNFEKEFYEKITGESFSKIMSQFTKSIYIRTNELESALKHYAHQLGIHIQFNKINSPEEVMQLHPEAISFIAADGAKSSMRQMLLGDNSTEEIPLQHIVELKYQAHGIAKPLNIFNEHFKTNKTIKNMAFEYIGKSKNNLTPVTIRFFIEKDVYQEIPEATFKNPLTLENEFIPDSLRNDIFTYLKIRANESGDIYQSDSSKLSKLVLALYAAKDFALEKNGKAWFLVGDAAMGVPYFRALNSGLILSSRLAQIMTGKQFKINYDIKKQIFFYNVHRPMHIGTEFAIARGKNLGLQGYDVLRKISGQLFPADWDFSIEEDLQKSYQGKLNTDTSSSHKPKV